MKKASNFHKKSKKGIKAEDLEDEQNYQKKAKRHFSTETTF
jgi:hypothetical protein